MFFDWEFFLNVELVTDFDELLNMFKWNSMYNIFYMLAEI